MLIKILTAFAIAALAALLPGGGIVLVLAAMRARRRKAKELSRLRNGRE